MLSEEERQLVEKDRHRVCERQRRQNMTEEQRSLERERRRLRDEQRRKSMSDEQRSLEKERRRIRERERRNNMSDEQRAEEMERRRVREREHRQNMDDEQRARDRERRRLRDKERRENMTEEQRAQERERRRLYEEQKRGVIVNGQLVSEKRRGPTHQIRNNSNQITGVEQDNNFASNSSDATNGYQIHAPGEDHLEAEMSHTSERSSTITLDPNETTVVACNVHHVVDNQNSLYSADVFGGNLISPPKQDNLNLEVTNTSESSSTTTVDLSKNTMVVFEDNHAVGDQSALYFTEDTDADQILALTRDNLEMGLTNMSERISSTIQGLDKMTELVSSGRETIGAHVNERNVLCADEQSRYDSKKITPLEVNLRSQRFEWISWGAVIYFQFCTQIRRPL